MAYFNQTPTQSVNNHQPSARQSQKSTRNASSYDFLSSATANADQDRSEKMLKKQKQNLYKDQLDQMVSLKAGKKTQEKLGGEEYQPYIVGGAPSRERKGWDVQPSSYQVNQDDQGRIDRDPEGYSPEMNQQTGDDYGINQHAADIAKNYIQGNNNYNNDYNNYAQIQDRPISNPMSHHSATQQPSSTFDNQDQLRDQLLSKIRHGYKGQNNQVYNTYQQAHVNREVDRLNFEKNVIDKAARERMVKEQEAAMHDYDKKKKLQREMYEANRRAADLKSSQKKFEKEQDNYSANKRAHDSLQQYERNDFEKKERIRKLQEENNNVLRQQMENLAIRKEQSKEGAFNSYKVGWDSIDNLYNSKVGGEPLRNSSQLLNQDRAAGRVAPTNEKFSLGMDNGYQPAKSNQNQYQDLGYEPQPYYTEQNTPSYPNVEPQGVKNYGRVRTQSKNSSGFNIITGEIR